MLIRKNDSGRSIVEMLGVLAIMGVITVMGISGYSQAVGKINRNKVIEDITRIAQEVRGLYAGKSSYYSGLGTQDGEGSGDTADVLIKLGFRKQGEAHAFGGVYYVNEVSETNGATAFKVVATEIPEKDCFYFENYGWQGAKEDTATCTTEAGLSDFSIQFR